MRYGHRVAEVECGAVSVSVTAASVLLDFIIVTSDPAATKAIVKTALATTAGASTALAVTVERVPTVAVRFCPPKRLGATPYRTVATSAYRMHPPLQVMSGTGGASKTTKPSSAAPDDSNSSSIGPIIGGVGEQRPCNALSARPARAHTPPLTCDPTELAPYVACLAHSWRLAGALLHRHRRLRLHEAEEGNFSQIKKGLYPLRGSPSTRASSGGGQVAPASHLDPRATPPPVPVAVVGDRRTQILGLRDTDSYHRLGGKGRTTGTSGWDKIGKAK